MRTSTFGWFGVLTVFVAILASFFVAPGVANAEDNGQFFHHYYTEVYGAPDPSMGGGTPLVDSFDTDYRPSNSEMQSMYASSNPGGGYLTIGLGVTGEGEYVQSGDFPSFFKREMPCAGDEKPLTGSISIGGGFTGWPTQDRTENTPTSAIGELALNFTPEPGGISFFSRVRYCFFDDVFNYWQGRNKFNAGCAVPISRGLTVGIEYERAFSARPTHDWGWAYVRCSF